MKGWGEGLVSHGSNAAGVCVSACVCVNVKSTVAGQGETTKPNKPGLDKEANAAENGTQRFFGG